MDDIRSVLSDTLPDFVCCAAVSGSLARMEAHEYSDVDLILVVDDRTSPISDTQAESAFRRAWDELDALGAVRPKPGGIYSVCARWKDLIRSDARGTIDEDITTFGHRIQLMMDAQPVAGNDCFEDVQRSLLHWYTETSLVQLFGEPGAFHWLWQDVQRYWRSLRSRTCWIHSNDESKAVMLNVKLRSSRLLLVFAFLDMLNRVQADQSRSPDEMIDSIVHSLTLTPVERLLGSAPDIQHWNTIWIFLRDWTANPSPELPEKIRTALTELANGIQGNIINGKTDQHDLPWLM